jgi:hypothetical protein
MTETKFNRRKTLRTWCDIFKNVIIPGSQHELTFTDATFLPFVTLKANTHCQPWNKLIKLFSMQSMVNCIKLELL